MEVCEQLSMSITAYLTELFATNLYGVHEVMRMRDTQRGLYDILSPSTRWDTRSRDTLHSASYLKSSPLPI